MRRIRKRCGAAFSRQTSCSACHVGIRKSAQSWRGLLVGINAASYAVGPTMLVVPEACQLSQDDYASVAIAMLVPV